MKKYIVLILIFIVQIANAQIKEINPCSFEEIDFGPEGEKAFNDNLATCAKIFEKVKTDEDINKLTKKEREIYENTDETKENYWETIGTGCSWYCGGGPKKVTASSCLKSTGEITYKAENAHDWNYKTAWAEGVPGYGIGEYLLYTFEAASPRITEIIIANGYVKSKSAWENNSRVKKIKVYLNNKPLYILNLKDIRGEQRFKVDPIGNKNRDNLEKLANKPDWTLKFEILEVYEGLKYDDVVISELYFNGIDVHCFAKGTKILMSDQSLKNIENLKIGDSIAFMDFKDYTIKSTKIEKLASVVHDNLVTYHFESGKSVTATQDHPFMIDKKGWASLQPEKSKQYQGFDNIKTIRIGDLFQKEQGFDKLISIELINGSRETFTISKTASGDNFIANGLIVGIEELK